MRTICRVPADGMPRLGRQPPTSEAEQPGGSLERCAHRERLTGQGGGARVRGAAALSGRFCRTGRGLRAGPGPGASGKNRPT